MKSLKQLLSKVKSGRLDKKTAKDLDNLVTRGDGFVVITKSKKNGYNRFDANRVDTPIEYGEPDTASNDNIHRQRSLIQEEHGTSHFFVVDQWNNIATITTTIEGAWGSCVVVDGYGFLLNNELTDFDALGVTWDNKTVANGPEGGKKQRRSALDIFNLTDSDTFGGKRPRSSMSPSLVLNKNTMEPILSVGSPGLHYLLCI